MLNRIKRTIVLLLTTIVSAQFSAAVIVVGPGTAHHVSVAGAGWDDPPASPSSADGVGFRGEQS